MRKYRVLIHGKNLLTNLDGVRRKAGFFTSVFVEALTAADAQSRALELVREDSHVREMTLNHESDPLKLVIDEVREVDSFDSAGLPRTALSLYWET